MAHHCIICHWRVLSHLATSCMQPYVCYGDRGRTDFGKWLWHANTSTLVMSLPALCGRAYLSQVLVFLEHLLLESPILWLTVLGNGSRKTSNLCGPSHPRASGEEALPKRAHAHPALLSVYPWLPTLAEFILSWDRTRLALRPCLGVENITDPGRRSTSRAGSWLSWQSWACLPWTVMDESSPLWNPDVF